jgi:hypothetical protein
MSSRGKAHDNRQTHIILTLGHLHIYRLIKAMINGIDQFLLIRPVHIDNPKNLINQNDQSSKKTNSTKNFTFNFIES